MKCAGQYDMIKKQCVSSPLGKDRLWKHRRQKREKREKKTGQSGAAAHLFHADDRHDASAQSRKNTGNHGQGSISYYLVWSLFGISFVSISTYILISGYFLCETSFSFRRILKLEGQVWFYSVALYLASLLLLRQPYDMSSLIAAVFPVLSCEYWFVTMYVGMIVLSPFLNKLLTGLTQRQFRLLLGILFVLFSLWPNVIFLFPGPEFRRRKRSGMVYHRIFVRRLSEALLQARWAIRQAFAALFRSGPAHSRQPLPDRTAAFHASGKNRLPSGSDVGLQYFL